jgi:hypothetical protein
MTKCQSLSEQTIRTSSSLTNGTIGNRGKHVVVGRLNVLCFVFSALIITMLFLKNNTESYQPIVKRQNQEQAVRVNVVSLHPFRREVHIFLTHWLTIVSNDTASSFSSAFEISKPHRSNHVNSLRNDAMTEWVV